jgi:hypothetical protein
MDTEQSMTLDEYQRIIVATQIEDWTHISCWGAGAGPSFLNKFMVWTKGAHEFTNLDVDSHAEVLSLKKNLLVSVATGITHNDDFIEPWANKFPDPQATSAYVDFFYAGTLVFRDIFVAVDGGRCRLPLPRQHINQRTQKVERLTVPEPKSIFYLLLNEISGAHDYYHYLNQSGIEIDDQSPWMA